MIVIVAAVFVILGVIVVVAAGVDAETGAVLRPTIVVDPQPKID